jgi:hypothetical protein
MNKFLLQNVIPANPCAGNDHIPFNHAPRLIKNLHFKTQASPAGAVCRCLCGARRVNGRNTSPAPTKAGIQPEHFSEGQIRQP